MQNTSAYFNIEELSIYMHESVSSLYKKTSQNLIPHFKQGKKLLFKKDDIDQWLEKFRQLTTDEMLSTLDHNS